VVCVVCGGVCGEVCVVCGVVCVVCVVCGGVCGVVCVVCGGVCGEVCVVCGVVCVVCGVVCGVRSLFKRITSASQGAIMTLLDNNEESNTQPDVKAGIYIPALTVCGFGILILLALSVPLRMYMDSPARVENKVETFITEAFK
jgi:hypothetical protein